MFRRASYSPRRELNAGTSGQAHVSPVQADVTVATAHSRGQPKPQGDCLSFCLGGIQGLAQPSATAASVKHSGGLRNSNLSKGYSTDVTTYAPLPSCLKSAHKTRISTHSERRHGLLSLTYHSSSGSSSISSISSMGSEDDQKASIDAVIKTNSNVQPQFKQGVSRLTKSLSNAQGREAIASRHSVA